MACIEGSLLRVDVMASQIRRIDRMLAQISKVCYVDKTLYLMVSPDEPLWVSTEIEANFEVKSNTRWSVEV